MTEHQTTAPDVRAASVAPAAPRASSEPAAPYDHEAWKADLMKHGVSLGLTNMERQILILTHARVRFGTGETYIGAKTIAASMGHALPNRVHETWKHAAELQMMSRPYHKPNEPPSRHHRRLLPSAGWRSAPEPDGGMRKSPPEPGAVSGQSPPYSGGELSPGSGALVAGCAPGSGGEEHPIRVFAYKDDLDPLSKNERTDQIASSSCAALGEDRRNEPNAQDVADQLSLAFDPTVGELVARGVTTDEARRWVGRYGADRVKAQVSEFDRQRTAGGSIANVAGWFQTALSRGFAKTNPKPAAKSTPPYAHQNRSNARVAREAEASQLLLFETVAKLAVMTPEQRDDALRRAIDSDVERFTTATRTRYVESEICLAAIVARLRAQKRDPLQHPTVLVAICEVLNEG